jgi:hypothetical protein
MIPPLIPRVNFWALAFLMVQAIPLRAQTAAEVTITKIDPQIVTTPAISYSGASLKSGRPKNWLEIEVTFNWMPRSVTEKYADDLTVNYYVLLSNKGAQYPQGALLTGQSALASVPARENDLRTVVYVSPQALERLFDGKIPASPGAAIVDIGVTISKQGQVVAEKSLKGRGQWWPQFQQVTGYLLNKWETPFGPLNWDYYQQVKKQ